MQSGESKERAKDRAEKRDDPPNEGVDAGKHPVPRSNESPHQTAEVPYGTGEHPEPPGGGGRASQRRDAPSRNGGEERDK